MNLILGIVSNVPILVSHAKMSGMPKLSMSFKMSDMSKTSKKVPK